MDECKNRRRPCHQHAYCKDTIGSYTCTCASGYSGDGKDCKSKSGKNTNRTGPLKLREATFHNSGDMFWTNDSFNETAEQNYWACSVALKMETGYVGQDRPSFKCECKKGDGCLLFSYTC